MKSEVLGGCCSGFLGSQSVWFLKDFVISSGSGGVFENSCSPQLPQVLLVSSFYFFLTLFSKYAPIVCNGSHFYCPVSVHGATV
ncbi:hypothetical protein SCA6_006274 [Theobroma cacao]